MTDYHQFIASKRRRLEPMGFSPKGELNKHLFDWQGTVVDWAVRRGRAALLEECGLGKTLQQLAWGEQVVRETNKPVMLHCPVGVRAQTKREADKKRHGRTPHGEKHANSKLTKLQIKAIRSARGRQCDIAEQFGISKSCVQAIRSRKTWRHVA